MPRAVRPLLERCLERDPKKRLRDIGDAWYLLADPAPAPAGAPRRGVRGPGWSRGCLRCWLRSCWCSGCGLRPPLRCLTDTRWRDFGVSLSARTGVGCSPRGAVLGCAPMTAWNGVRLPGTEDADYPFWSPDSSAVGFFARRTSAASLGAGRGVAQSGGRSQCTWRIAGMGE